MIIFATLSDPVRRLPALVLMLLALLVTTPMITGCGAAAPATDTPAAGATVDPDSGLPMITEQELPPEARETLSLIDSGGPFPYEQDGATFSNREGILPDQEHGFYREYTVETPGEDDRGARRIVTGNEDTIFYYTDDHYASFSRIAR